MHTSDTGPGRIKQITEERRRGTGVEQNQADSEFKPYAVFLHCDYALVPSFGGHVRRTPEVSWFTSVFLLILLHSSVIFWSENPENSWFHSFPEKRAILHAGQLYPYLCVNCCQFWPQWLVRGYWNCVFICFVVLFRRLRQLWDQHAMRVFMAGTETSLNLWWLSPVSFHLIYHVCVSGIPRYKWFFFFFRLIRR